MNFKFCPNCGRQGTVKHNDSTRYFCHNCNWEYWNNPHAAVSVIFVNDKKELLFAKRGRNSDKGKYDFPGGFLDYNEDPYAAAIREIKEETGADIVKKDIVLMALYTWEYVPGVSALDIVMLVKTWQKGLRANDDVAGLDWKPVSFMSDPSFRPKMFYAGLEGIIDNHLSP
jgi:8-oxo-dGTP pyrophosphatase MutT (NUDIX family)